MIRLAVFDIDRTLIPPELGHMAPETVAAIRQLQRRGIRTAIASGRMLHLLPDELKETATLREDFPELSLADLAAKHSPPITKSGLNHRLKKLLELAGMDKE